jgi:hypothetical protein
MLSGQNIEDWRWTLWTCKSAAALNRRLIYDVVNLIGFCHNSKWKVHHLAYNLCFRTYDEKYYSNAGYSALWHFITVSFFRHHLCFTQVNGLNVPNSSSSYNLSFLISYWLFPIFLVSSSTCQILYLVTLLDLFDLVLSV